MMTALASLCKLDIQKLIHGGGRFLLFIFAVAVILIFYSPLHWLTFGYLMSFYSFSITLISSDESTHSCYLYSALPSKRSDVVCARFVLYFLLACVLNVLFLLLAVVSPAQAALPLLIVVLSFCFCFNMIFVGLIQALCYRFKYSTIRITAIIIYAISIAASVTISGGLASTFAAHPLDMAFSASPLVTALLLAIVGLFAYFLCYLLAAKLYKRKDFTE